MNIRRLLTPWWMSTPDPEVTSPEVRAETTARAERHARQARSLAAFMARQRQANHFSQRIAAAHQERR